MKDETNVLMKCGLKRHEAKTLIYLFKHDTAFSRNIEHEMDLRQPEVSQAMKNFLKRKWIKLRYIEREGKGRPTIEYHLAIKKEKILLQLKKEVDGRLGELSNVLDKLSEI